MCLDFYGFREKPFNLTPDPRFVFLSKPHQEAFAYLLYGINNRTGFIAFTGEVGSGKTTVLRALLNKLDPNHYRTALIFNPGQSPRRLLQKISREFGIPFPAAPGSGSWAALNQLLLREYDQGRTVVLIIDEALKLSTWIGPGSRGGQVRRLQGLLLEAGAPGAPSNGVYDPETLAGVKEFQLAKGIGQDRIAGSQTFMLFYGSVDRFGAPWLTAGQE